MTPLMWAARNGRVATVKLLLAKQARLDVLSGDLSQGKLTALGFAEQAKHADIVRLLKQAGATQTREAPKSFKVRIRRGGEWITA
jgi:ankyrin repeat protein